MSDLIESEISSNRVEDDSNTINRYYNLGEDTAPSALLQLRALEGGSTHSSSPQSSTIRISTPILDPADELIVENWIQQSLDMPSTTNINNNSNDVAVSRGGNDNFTVNLGHHRRERSLGSGFFVENDIHSSGIYSTTPPPAATTTSINNFIQSNNNIYKAASTTRTLTPTRNENDNNNNTSNIASHPFFKPDTRADWGSNSLMFNGDDVMFGGSSSFSLNASISGQMKSTTIATDSHPLTVSRVTIKPLSSRDDNSVGGVISSVIHDAARITDWQTVVELCQQQPENAAFTGRDGWTALHHACNRRCPYPNVVESLIRAYPDALLMTEEKGWLPLHYACRFKAPKNVVKLLLHMYPEKGRVGVSRPDRKGRSSLYYAVRYDAPSGVVGLLLEVDASAVLEEDQNADSPLALVWDDWAEKLDGKRTIQKILGGGIDIKNNNNQDNNNNNMMAMMNNSMGIIFDGSTNVGDNDHTDARTATKTKVDLFEKAKMVRKRLENQTKVFDRWNKVNLFLKAAFGFGLDEDWELAADNSYYSEEKKRDTGFPDDESQLCNSTGRHQRTWRILHAISAIKCHYSLFLLAISLHPEQAFELDRDDLRRVDNIYTSKDCNKSIPSDLTALHLAASSHASGDSGKMVLTQLLALNPDAAESVDTEGSTPLHRISENNFKSDWNIDGVDEINGANINANMTIDLNGRLPLHRASSAISYCDINVEDDIVISRSVLCRLLQQNDEAARCSNYFGCLPLHLVAQHGTRWDVQVQTLYDANTAAVRARTGVKLLNRLPIHLATANVNSDVSLISKLVEHNPRGTSQADRKGSLPLHLACESGLSWKSVQVIHEAFPEAIRQAEQNRRGWNALHMAASSEHSDDELITHLVQLYPEAATDNDSDDRYPLHLACMSGKAWDDGVSSLFEANADAIRCRDKDGLLPLHIVAFQYRTKTRIECEDSLPKVNDIRSRRLSKSGVALEADQLTAKETKDALELSNLFELLKADPTVLL